MLKKIARHYEVVIVGAGPAGMTAAITLRNYGLSVAVFDEQANPGGQIFRNVQNARELLADVMQRESLSRATVSKGSELIARFVECDVSYFPSSFVWAMESTDVIAVKWQGQVYQTSAQTVLIASGAQERPVPFTGWQLPGVMGVGAAQIMLKSAGAVPDSPPVLFGTGPLFYLYAAQLIASGMKPAAMLDTASRSNAIRSLQYLPGVVSAPAYIRDGVRLLKMIKDAGVAHYKNVTALMASGDAQLDRVEFISGGRATTVKTKLLLSHHGVIPELQLLRAAGVACHWNESGQCWHPLLDEWGASSVDGVYVCGDGAAINGVYSAEYDAGLASIDILYRAAVIRLTDRDKLARSLRRKSRRDKKIRPFLESTYRVPDVLLHASGDTIVCRCESITAAQIEQAVDQGCRGPNQVKSFTRSGMGACQGRMCGPAVEAIIARKTGLTRTEVGHFRARPPARPISLAALASLDQS